MPWRGSGVAFSPSGLPGVTRASRCRERVRHPAGGRTKSRAVGSQDRADGPALASFRVTAAPLEPVVQPLWSNLGREGRRLRCSVRLLRPDHVSLSGFAAERQRSSGAEIFRTPLHLCLLAPLRPSPVPLTLRHTIPNNRLASKCFITRSRFSSKTLASSLAP